MLLKFAHMDGALELQETLDSSRPGKAVADPVRLSGLRRSDRDTGLQLLSVLQTTLDLEELLRLFSREITAAVAHSAVVYRHRSRGIRIRLGRETRRTTAMTLVVDNQDLGEVRFSRGRPFDAHELQLLQNYVSYLVCPLRNALRYHDAVQASLTDPLTGVHNRAFFEAALRREIGLSRRHRTQLSLIVLDLDHFKSINDEHGHLAGDAILRTTTSSIASCLRETDILARFGGDEFTVLLSNTGRRGARVVAEHIVDSVGRTRCETSGTVLRVSVTLGVSTLLRNDDQRSLFRRADDALYQAKSEGGSCLAIATSRGVRCLPTEI